MGKHSKTTDTTTDDISTLQRQVQDLYELVGSLRASRDYGIQALKRIDAKFVEVDDRISERISDRYSGKAEAQVEMPTIPNEYQRAEVLRMAASANLHPDQIVPTAQKFLAFVSGEEQAPRNKHFAEDVRADFVSDLLRDYANLSDSGLVSVSQVRQVLRRAAGLS